MSKNNDIKTALACCGKYPCEQCPYYTDAFCPTNLRRDALSLINELTEENERLRAENAKYEAENHAEFNKWLKLEEATKRHHAELFEEAKIAVKEDTVRKMQERLTSFFANDDILKHCEVDAEYVNEQIDRIAKKMLKILDKKNINTL